MYTKRRQTTQEESFTAPTTYDAWKILGQALCIELNSADHDAAWTWVADPEMNWFVILINSRKPVERLNVQGCSPKRHMLSITGQFPSPRSGSGCSTYLPSGNERPHIKVNGNRGLAIVARNIVKRLLPGYRATLQVALENQAIHLRKLEARTKAYLELCELLNQEPSKHYQHRFELSWYHKDRISGDLCVFSPTSIDLNLRNLTLAQAVEILSVTQGFSPQQEVDT